MALLSEGRCHGQLGYATLKPISWHFWKGDFGDYINRRQALTFDTGRTFLQSRFHNKTNQCYSVLVI